MARHLEGRVAIVTGGGGGIGRGIVHELAAQGAKIVVNDLGTAVDGKGASRQMADVIVNEVRSHGAQAVASYDSVSTMEGAERIVKTALDSFGKLDIVIHTAGILRDRMIFNMTEEEFDSVIAVHLKGMFAIAKPASILFRQQRSGRIIGFTSTSGLYGNIGQANYSAAKDGIAGFCRTVARDLGRYGVTVNAIAPIADTRMTQTITEEARKKQASVTVGQGVPQTAKNPEDVAPMVVYLCTDHAKDINGQIFYVAGGTVALVNNPYAAKTIMKKNGRWTFDELADQLPDTIGRDFYNPVPPQAQQTTTR